MSLKDNLMNVIKSFCALNQKKFIMENLCIGMSYIIFHTHRVWNNLIGELISMLSTNIEEANCLVTIMGYMASECEDEGIVIEESLRESFFDYIDQICDVIFTNIFGSLSTKLL